MAPAVPIEQAVERFISHCRSMGLEESTLRAYRSGLDAMVRAVGNIDMRRFDAGHLDEVFAQQRWKASTRNNRLAQFKTFFAWCRARGYMHPDSNPAFGWRNTKVPNTQRLRIPAEQWGALFEACKHPQETITLATGLFLFLRASEQVRIQLKHVHLEDGEIEIYRKKTEDYDTMPISAELAPYLHRHLMWMRSEYGYDPEWYLIPTRGDLERNESNQFILGSGKVDPTKPPSHPHVIVQRVLKRAGYPTAGEGEHTLRRSGARAYFESLVDQGYDGALAQVQAMLGHELAATTERYIGKEWKRHKRNQTLKGRPMFPHLSQQNAQIIPIRREM